MQNGGGGDGMQIVGVWLGWSSRVQVVEKAEKAGGVCAVFSGDCRVLCLAMAATRRSVKHGAPATHCLGVWEGCWLSADSGDTVLYGHGWWRSGGFFSDLEARGGGRGRWRDGRWRRQAE